MTARGRRPVLPGDFHFAAPAPEVVAFLSCQLVLALAVVQVGLPHPVPDRPGRWFELLGQFLRRAARPHELDAQFDWLVILHGWLEKRLGN